MTEREKIFTRIRDALKTQAPMPGHHDGAGKTHAISEARNAIAGAKQWLPDPGADSAEWLAQFEKLSAELKTTVHICASEADAHAKLREIAVADGWKSVAAHQHPLVSPAVAALPLPLLDTTNGYDANAMAKCDVGITACDALVAQTGSIFLTNRTGGGRALSVLPPHHVVIAHREQLVPDLPSAFELMTRIYGPANWPSMSTLITGPSRTGDIERILVLGAHGPRKLTVLLV